MRSQPKGVNILFWGLFAQFVLNWWVSHMHSIICNWKSHNILQRHITHRALKLCVEVDSFSGMRDNLYRPVWSPESADSLLSKKCNSRIMPILKFCRNLQCKTDLPVLMTLQYTTVPEQREPLYFPWLDLKVTESNWVKLRWWFILRQCESYSVWQQCDEVIQKCYFLTAAVKNKKKTNENIGPLSLLTAISKCNMQRTKKVNCQFHRFTPVTTDASAA